MDSAIWVDASEFKSLTSSTLRRRTMSETGPLYSSQFAAKTGSLPVFGLNHAAFKPDATRNHKYNYGKRDHDQRDAQCGLQIPSLHF